MKTIHFVSIAVNAAALFTFGGLCGHHASAQTKSNPGQKKNVLMIAIDDLKPLLGCYGDTVAQTPNVDKLSKRGTLFTHAYCQQAISAATRASLLTGWCPDRTRVWDLQTQIRDENPDVVTLPQYFKENGFEVAGIGKIYDPRSVDKKSDAQSWSGDFMSYNNYLNSDYDMPVMASYQDPSIRCEYEKYCSEAKEKGLTKKREIEEYVIKHVKPTSEAPDIPDNAYIDGAVADGAIDYINNYSSDKPFFLAVGFKKPHLPFCAPKKYWDLYEREKMPLATYRKRALNSPNFAYHKCGELQLYSDIPAIITFSDIDNVIIPDDKARELIHGYYACVSYIDEQIGKVVEALDRNGLSDNTIIVLWGDHGWHLGDHGLWNKHTNFEHATRVPMMIIDPSSMAQQVDIPVEFLSIYPTICEMAGLQVPEALDGENLTDVVRNVTEAKINKKYAASQYPRVGKMGYSLRTDRYRYTVWVDWRDRKLNPDNVIACELYDYEVDPDETINVASEPTYAEVVAMMEDFWNDYKTNRINNLHK